MTRARPLRFGRRLVGVAIVQAALLAVCCVGSASAGTARLDTGFGKSGVVDVEPPRTAPEVAGWSEWVDQIATARNGSTFVLVRASCWIERCGDRLINGIFRYESDGSLDPDFGGAGGVRRAADPAAPYNPLLKVDSHGRPLLIEMAPKTRVRVSRLTQGGFPDPRFGDDGIAEFECGCEIEQVDYASARGGGGTLLLAQRYGNLKGTIFRVIRLRADGSRVASYGRDGVASFRLEGASLPNQVATAPGGGIYFAGNPGLSGSTPYLGRVSVGGRLDTRFISTTRRSLRELRHRFARVHRFTVGAIIVRRLGKLDLLGGASYRGKGFSLRMRPNGRWLRSYVRRGMRRLPSEVLDAVAGREGATLMLTPDEAVYQSATLRRLLPGGRSDPAFGRSGTPTSEIMLGGGFSLAALSGRRIAVTTLGWHACRSGCPPTPALARFLEPPVGRR